MIHSEIQRQATTILSAGNETSSTSITATLASQALDNLKLHKLQSLQFKQEIDHLNYNIVSVKDAVKNKIEAKLPNNLISTFSESDKKHERLLKGWMVLIQG